MTMGQYDPDCPSLSFIAIISVTFSSKKVEKLHFEKFGGLRALGELKRHYYMTMGQYDPEVIIGPDKVQY